MILKLFKRTTQYRQLSFRRDLNGRAYFQAVGKEPLLYRTLGEQLQRAADIYSELPAFISCHENRRLTFAQAKHEAENLAIQLSQLGLRPGEHVGIWAPNTVQWYITYLATSLAGFPLVCINPMLQAEELGFALRKARVKTLITMHEYRAQKFSSILNDLIPDLQSDRHKFPDLQHVIIDGQGPEREFHNYAELMGRSVAEEDRRHLNEVTVRQRSPEAPCNIQFTSGTTGQPKAAVLNHFNHVNMGIAFGSFLCMDKPLRRFCLNVPCFHAFGLGIMSSALHYGAALVSPSATFDAVACLHAIEQEKCHLMAGTPTMYVDMVQQQRKLKKCLESLNYGLVGGAACTPQVFKETKEILGIEYFRIGYGQSELTTGSFSQYGTEPLEEAVSTIGVPMPHLEVKVINDNGDTVAYGELGELCVRGFSSMIGYLDDEQKTKETKTADGWVRTGDEVILEANGVARFMGRKKEMIIRGGENIFPKEIEDFLDSHPDILEAMVIGVPDERLGEEVCAYLRLKPKVKDLSVEDLRSFCKGKIAHFKIPRYVRIVTEFPKTNSGKIQKFKLAEMFIAEK